jgi:hypothetical protein
MVLACVSPTAPAGDLFAPIEAGSFRLGVTAQKEKPLRVEAGGRFSVPLGTVSQTLFALPFSGNAKSVTSVALASPPEAPVSVAVRGEHDVSFGDHTPKHRTSATGAVEFARDAWEAGMTLSQKWENGIPATRVMSVEISHTQPAGTKLALSVEQEDVDTTTEQVMWLHLLIPLN